MLQPSTLQFLTDLQANNSKDWTDLYQPAYQVAKADFGNLVSHLLAGLQTSDSQLASTPLEAKKCLFSLNRDRRFSADKSPYKTNLGAWLNLGGKKMSTAGYYLNIEPGNSFLAGGIYRPEPDKLAQIRQEIDYTLADFERIVHELSFQRHFGALRPTDALKRLPKGYAADNPALDYLKLKSFTAFHPLPDTRLTCATLSTHLLQVGRSLTPLVHYLNWAIY